ncbi:peptidyl-prolyl cis-trans isomerase [Patiriisocius hiemis]|uniref:Peptidyl-prolyl cis-trans isomerase n=1 Tax=Patiriisocius hiemis TaxID=3075604 RepID=A0ABU2Y950_9FLAO|nr:peptidyl-prolyl cis-trans isomerase [Constantimarinum sp. W242]MDT0554705.1 peptidyl-prolyl cis-trans isomerase [Constantimarinum sp. W242]
MRFFVLFLTALLLQSCDYLKQDETRIPVARVNDSYLYQEDIEALITDNTSREDSTLIVSNYINRWATQKLLIDQAKINLSPQTQDEYNKLVNDYRNDLYTEAYKNVIVNKQLDSTVSSQEFLDYYELNKENFLLNDELLKIRYIVLPPNYSDISVTNQKFTRFNTEDQEELINQSIQFKDQNFNDSIWVKKKVISEKIPSLETLNSSDLKKGNNLQLKDSLGVYLIHIKDVLNNNDIAPLEYIKPTIEQIIINKRKLELIKKLEVDIKKDAIKNRKFETY